MEFLLNILLTNAWSVYLLCPNKLNIHICHPSLELGGLIIVVGGTLAIKEDLCYISPLSLIQNLIIRAKASRNLSKLSTFVGQRQIKLKGLYTQTVSLWLRNV